MSSQIRTPVNERALKQALRAELTQARAQTLALFTELEAASFSRQVHPEFSPVGWHLGHIGYTEAFWILDQCLGEPEWARAYESFFSTTQSVKCERVHLPPRAEILTYLTEVRQRVLTFLEDTSLDSTHWLLRRAQVFYQILQHEYQHGETIQIVQRLMGQASRQARLEPPQPPAPLYVPAGPLVMGCDQPSAYDNEAPVHLVEVAAFWIDPAPVNQAQYSQFMAAGGYAEQDLWSQAGWEWKCAQSIQAPLYWDPQAPQAPVCHLSAYEAEACARWLGKRLPTEAEWEKAAQAGLPGVGSVWEWTASLFAPYPGFQAYPYAGYSAAYFDGQHRVLRGGSWATARALMRPSFRTWYHPWVRQIFAGLRCVSPA